MFGSRHCTPLVVLALTLVGAQAMADPATLAQLETQARSFAPTARLAQAELAVAEQRSAVAQARQGAQLFGAAGFGSAREAVTDTLSRDYQRAHALVGMRWPILGSRSAQLRNMHDANHAVSRGRILRQQMEDEAAQSVRRAYLQHLYSTQRIQVAQAFLQARPQMQGQLLHRRDAGVLLEADRLDLVGLLEAVAAARDGQVAAQEHARADIARLTGQPVTHLETHELLWPAACVAADALAAPDSRSHAAALAQLELDAARLQSGFAQTEGVEASVSLAQSLSRDVGGPPGRSTRVGVDITVPLQWHAQRDAALAQAQGEIDRAQALLQLRQSELAAATERALASYRLSEKETASHMQRLKAALEAVRVAQLRQDAFDGDGYSKVLMARHALYQAALQVVDGAHKRNLAALDLLALRGNDCAPMQSDDGNPWPNPLAAALAALATPVPGAAGPSADTSSQGRRGLSWYVWQGQAMLDQPQRLGELPAGSQRLLLSFTAAQLRVLAEPAGQARLQAYVAQAHARGVRVELLLGEPTWVRPQERHRLLALMDTLRGLPFDGLHLDLERSQLPDAEQPHWDLWLIDTLNAVHQRTSWPMALTTHYRELHNPRFARRVHAAGVSELVAMVYVNRPERVAAIVRPLTQGLAQLRLSVAQSIEHTLPAQESSFTMGRAASLQRWYALAQQLGSLAGFQGIVVQSWEDYLEAQP